ncbi:PrgI family protein [Peribacillus castrilensis]|uniref:PrgI family protein n=1 Tax=Bacillaceae TaxID=186817 RepID=UPI0006601233|nr:MULTISPECIES: PrgI family protein [Bacillaceae]MCT1390130.1 PrgI family protein [Peribacillus frigoritolerans]NCT39979.1 hypothetical protein [Peribacillus frigoritolerans]PRA81591.1 hypothetical protein CQ056_20545 [Peribacillus simplex]
MAKIKGRCTTAVFNIPNVIRGLAGGKEGISLPFSATVTQVMLILVFFLVSLPVQSLMAVVLPIMPALARVMIICVIIPCFLGYMIGIKREEEMNIVRYWYVKMKTKYEPAELIRFEEVEQSKTIHFQQKIRMKRHVPISKRGETE